MAVGINSTANPPGDAAGAGTKTSDYNDQLIGTPHPDRLVAVIVTAQTAGGPNILACTLKVAGINQTQKKQISLRHGLPACAAYCFAVPDGTVANIAVTFDASPSANQNHITVYEITGADANDIVTISDGSNSMNASGDPLTMPVNVDTDGGVLAGACGATNLNAKTWVGGTALFDFSTGGHRHTSAKYLAAGSYNVICQGSSSGEFGCSAGFVFKPFGGGPTPPVDTGNMLLAM